MGEGEGAADASQRRERKAARARAHVAARRALDWSEGRSALERKLGSLFEELERRADEDERLAEERARREEERRRQEERRLERELRARIEKARATRLSDEIAAWRRAQQIREYVAVLRLRLDHLEESERERVSAWCEWAEEWSRRSDPTINLSRIVGLDEERDGYTHSQPLPGVRY